MNQENNKNQNNGNLWLIIGLVGTTLIIYWWIKDELDKQKKELETHLTKQTQELTQVQLERERGLRKKIQELEQQLVKLNEKLNKKSNHSNQGFNLLNNIINYPIQWFKKKLLN